MSSVFLDARAEGLPEERLPGRLLVLDAMRKLVWEKINGDGSLAGSGGPLLGYCSLSSGK